MSQITTETEVRLSYMNLIDPRQRDAEHPNEMQYSTAVLIPKTDVDTIKAIRTAIAEALADGVAKKWGGKMPPKSQLKNPLRDGDEDRPDDEVYAGHYFLNAKGPKGGKEKPILLNKNGDETTDPAVIYSGVNGKVALQFYAFDVNGNKGVAAGLSAFISSETGEPLGNTVTAASAREAFGVKPSAAASAAAGFAGTKSETAEPAAGADDADVDPWGA